MYKIDGKFLLIDNPCEQKNSWLGLDDFVQISIRALENYGVPEYFSGSVGITCVNPSS